MGVKDKLSQIKNTLYWDFYYTIGYSSSAGLANATANLKTGDSFTEGFGEGYVNNFTYGLGINLLYPVVFNKLKESKHYRLYANLLTIGVNLSFLAWHYFTGTDNYLETSAMNTSIGLLMVNKHVSENKSLESRL